MNVLFVSWTLSWAFIGVLALPTHATDDVDRERDVDCSVTQSGGPSGPGKDCIFPYKLPGGKVSHLTKRC